MSASRRRGRGRPKGPRPVGTVLPLSAEEYLDRTLDGKARLAAAYILKRTGASFPGYGSVEVSRLARAIGVGRRQLFRIREKMAPVVRTHEHNGVLVCWSAIGARARAGRGHFAAWWAAFKAMHAANRGAPFLLEARGWLVAAEAEAALSGTPQKHRENTRASLVSEMSPMVTSIPERYHEVGAHKSGTKQGREIQDCDLTSPAAFHGVENQNPPLSLDPRDVRPGAESGAPEPPTPPGGGLNGFRGEREGPVRALSDTVTADHVPGGSRVPSPSSETRLMAARANEEEDDVTREEQIEALRAIEAGEVQLPIAPTRPAPSPDGRPVRLGEVAPSGPATARARPRASGGAVTPGILKAALLAAMARHKPGWTFKGGVRNDEAIYELGRRYCANRTVEWLGYWLEEQVRRFVVDPRADGHQPTGLVLFLRVKGVTEPYIPEPEGKFPPLGSGDPPPIAELFAALDKASADMWTPRKASEG